MSEWLDRFRREDGTYRTICVHCGHDEVFEGDDPVVVESAIRSEMNSHGLVCERRPEAKIRKAAQELIAAIDGSWVRGEEVWQLIENLKAAMR